MDLRWDTFGTLSAREQATLILIGLVVVTYAAVPTLRRSVRGMVRPVLAALFTPRIVLVFGSLVLWCGGWVLLAQQIGAWQVTEAKDTLVIVMGFGFPFLMWAILKADSGAAIARHTVAEVVSAVALVVYVIGLWPFPLWAELITQAFAAFLVMLRATAEHQDDGRAVSRLCTFLLFALGAASVLWAAVHGVEAIPSLDPLAAGRDFALTLWVPLVIVPYVYVVAYVSACEQIVSRERAMTDKKIGLRVWFAIAVGFRARYGLARQFHAQRAHLPPERTFRGIVASINAARR
jgi:hypothetical protein